MWLRLLGLIGGKAGGISSVVSIVLGAALMFYGPRWLGIDEATKIAEQLQDVSNELEQCQSAQLLWTNQQQQELTEAVDDSLREASRVGGDIFDGLESARAAERHALDRIRMQPAERDGIVAPVLRDVLGGGQ